jgi:hypothetical protein
VIKTEFRWACFVNWNGIRQKQVGEKRGI